KRLIELVVLATSVSLALFVIVTIGIANDFSDFNQSIIDDLQQSKNFASDAWGTMKSIHVDARDKRYAEPPRADNPYEAGPAPPAPTPPTGRSCDCAAAARKCPRGPPGPKGAPGDRGE
ncbi:hypothetical protein PFISCL1PPCAC_20791, partial [Pristionchus fissidentatus]